jgi:DNA replication protein DnaC
MNETRVDTTAMGEEITAALRGLKLPTLAGELVPRLIAAGLHDAIPVVREVLEMERQDRWERRVERLRYQSNLPPGKTFETFKMGRLPRPLAAKIWDLSRGEFVERCGNVLSVGLPGTGKSHVSSGLGHALVERGHSVLWVPTFKLVQDLLAAKRDLSLPRALRKLDAFEVLVLDDIGYVQQAAEEVEVLFTLLAERYERRSVVITTNLVFSQWDQIFKNPMTTAAAIDRLVHHCTILEFDVESYRSEEAERAAGGALPAENETAEPRKPDEPPRPGRRRSKE